MTGVSSIKTPPESRCQSAERHGDDYDDLPSVAGGMPTAAAAARQPNVMVAGAGSVHSPPAECMHAASTPDSLVPARQSISSIGGVLREGNCLSGSGCCCI